MTFAPISPNRYQVYSDDGVMLGTANKEVFTSYPNGKPVERFWWFARTKTYQRVPGQFSTRAQAAEALVTHKPKWSA